MGPKERCVRCILGSAASQELPLDNIAIMEEEDGWKATIAGLWWTTLACGRAVSSNRQSRVFVASSSNLRFKMSAGNNQNVANGFLMLTTKTALCLFGASFYLVLSTWGWVPRSSNEWLLWIQHCWTDQGSLWNNWNHDELSKVSIPYFVVGHAFTKPRGSFYVVVYWYFLCYLQQCWLAVPGDITFQEQDLLFERQGKPIRA